MARREFQLIDGSSEKFWAIELDGSSFTVHFGRIGTAGQAKEKSFGSDAEATREHDKLISAKVRKGYHEVASTGATPKAQPAAKATAKAPAKATAKAKSKETPSEQSSRERDSSAEGSTFPAEIVRTLELPPDSRRVVTWEQHDPLVKPKSPPFVLADGLQRLAATQTDQHWLDWKKAKIPDFPSREEAHFWLKAASMFSGNRTKKNVEKISQELSTVTFDGNLSKEEIVKILDNYWIPTHQLFGCVAALLTPEDLLLERAGAGVDRVEPFFRLCLRLHVLQYLSPEQQRTLAPLVKERLKVWVPTDVRAGMAVAYHAAPWLGLSDALVEVIANLPDDFFKELYATGNDYLSSRAGHHWLIFGLPSKELVNSEMRRLGVLLTGIDDALAWLALTDFDGLDLLAESISHIDTKQDALRLAKVLKLIRAPEAAIPALTLVMHSKAPQAGHEWLVEHPLEAAVGLAPAAMGNGKLATAAKEHLETLQRGEAKGALLAALPHLDAPVADWLKREIIENEDSSLPELEMNELPAELKSALEGQDGKAAKLPTWLTVPALPPVRLAGGRLDQASVTAILSAAKTTAVGKNTCPLLKVVKATAEPNSLDAFAWKVFELWLNLGAPSKDKWALGCIGHLGGDASVLKLTPLIREWPGESQHQRAVFALECLRAVGSETALMALNGIAQKLKFAGLKKKANEKMEEIAAARGLTGEQLADRIVPDCGLDETGSRTFDFGPRQFRFVLGAELKPAVRDETGKVRPNLPKPSQKDDSELADAAVAEWKLLKKTLREVLKIQAVRLEEAMITGRRWPIDDFKNLLIAHPLMINLVRQLIFGIYDKQGTIVRTFRVTEDRTIADENDEDVALPDSDAFVGVVHPAHLDESVLSKWGEILSDYEIIPPFQQLGRSIHHAEKAELNATEITRFKGPKIPGISLYGILERTHWLKDTPADAGGFCQHSKYFPSANMTAFIQYDPGLGIGYYEEEQQLSSIYFVTGHVEPDMWGDHKNRLKVKDVDPMILSEVLRMAHLLASKGE